MLILKGKRGQLAIFVIIAILLVSSIAIYFLVRESIDISGIPEELQPVFSYYLTCVEDETRAALDIAGTQGGRIDVGDYVPGSDYAPFSNQLNFLGFPVPYWYYASGNGVIKEQIPTKSEIEREIGDFVESNLEDCDFSRFREQGFEIESENAQVNVRIEDERVVINTDGALIVRRGEQSARKSEHNTAVESKFGKYYDLARNIYTKEKGEAFLENYSLDVLRLYAPVDGVEIECSPKIWRTNEVVDELKSGLEANIISLKLNGDYYSLSDKNDKYFVVDLESDEAVRFLYSKDWPTKIEIYGDNVDDALMIAEPVGNEEGLGILGFCYAPYHFVYDASFPVMIQIGEEEIFQFPVAVIIDKNLPRNRIEDLEIDYLEESFDLCDFKNQDIKVNIVDSNLNNIDANITYQCFTQRCRLGESKEGIFEGRAPICGNGYLDVRKDGYEGKKVLFSTNKEREIDVILDKEYEVEIELLVDGKALNGNALVSFAKDNETKSTFLPENKKIKLTEGLYNVKVNVYGNTSIVIPESNRRECRNIPREGILGFLGSTKEECFDITLPETKIDYALTGGGNSQVYIFEDDIKNGKMTIKVGSFPTPKSLNDFENNFALYETQGVDIEFI